MDKNLQDAKILLVDDHVLNANVIRDFLTISGYQVVVRHEGAACMAYLEQEPLPDLLLLDIQMPEMDGIQVIRLIRSHEREDIRQLIVVALTALAMDGDAKRCLDAGANYYLSKPIRLQNLVQFVQEKLCFHRATDQ